MIGLDTNVVVRYLTQDDPKQAALANRVIERELTENRPGFLGIIVLVETVSVLRRLYAVRSEEIHEMVAGLLGSPAIVIENRAVVAAALARARQQACDFADAIIASTAAAAGCEQVMTFDRRAARAGMTLLE